jgi:hypothetical protein
MRVRAMFASGRACIGWHLFAAGYVTVTSPSTVPLFGIPEIFRLFAACLVVFKIRNPNYSQIIGREELFERDRHTEPVAGWHTCAAACEELPAACRTIATHSHEHDEGSQTSGTP